MRKPLISACFLALIFTVQSTFGGLVAQESCGWNPDYEQDYAIGITDVLAILGIFGATDADQDGIWDSSDLCEDLDACNFDADPTEPCLYEDAFGVCGGEGLIPELLIGTWQFSTAAGAIQVGPVPYSNEWFSSFAFGLQDAQYDDLYTFHADGTISMDYDGTIIDAFSDYSEQSYDCNGVAMEFLPEGGTSGEPAFALVPDAEACYVPLHRHQRRRLGVRHCVPFGNEPGIARARR